LTEIERFAKNARFVHWLRLTGGEPFLRKDYVDIVRVFVSNLDLYLLTTPTNALLPPIVSTAVKKVLSFYKGKYVITVSLDGPKEIHDEIRGVRGNWEKALLTFQKLKVFEKYWKNFKVLFGYTISPFNVGLFDETVDEVRKRLPFVTYDDFHVNLFQVSEVYYHSNWGMFEREEISDFRKKAAREIDNILRKKSKLGTIELIEGRYLLLAKKYLRKLKTPIECNVYNLSAFVDPYGNVYPCSVFNFKLGNLRENDYNLLKILTSRRAMEARRLIEEGKCPHCWTPCEAHQLIVANFLTFS